MPDPADPTVTHAPPAELTTAGRPVGGVETRAGPADPRPGPPPVAVPGYEVLEEIGRGAMGVVYRARQSSLNRVVALKMVLGGEHTGPKDLIRFLAEAEAVAAVRDPHVVQVYEAGESAGRPYMALEYLPGGTLADRLRGQPLPPREAAALVEKVARGVQAAHDQWIVHRDLKPGNVLFDDRGEPKVADFGLAKRTAGSDLTHSHAVMGTPVYMAPEQARGNAKLAGPAADVWALGVILYECLTGRRPFESADTIDLLHRIAAADPVAPRRVVPGLPRELEVICLKCLRKEPYERYATARELADDLRNHLDGRPITARPVGPVARFLRLCQGNGAIAGLTAVAVGLLAAGTITSTVLAVRAERAREQAELANRERERERERQKQLVAEFLRFLASNQHLSDEQQRGLVGEFLQAHPEFDAQEFRRAVKPEFADAPMSGTSTAATLAPNMMGD